MKVTTPIIDHHIDHPSAWKSRDFKSQDDYALDLEPRHIAALDAALGEVREGGLGFDDITKASFPLDGIQDFIDEVSHELMSGRGSDDPRVAAGSVFTRGYRSDVLWLRHPIR